MKFLLIASCLLVASASGAIKAIKTLDEIIQEVITDTDIAPTDGVISVEEFQNEILTKWAGGAEVVYREAFINMWVAEYNDDRATTAQFFDNMDAWKDGKINEMDLLMILPQIDQNLDGAITTAEFTNFIKLMHPDGSN